MFHNSELLKGSGCLLGKIRLLMQVLVLGGNPAADSDAFEEYVAKARAARPDLDIAWQASDPGQIGS